jgi:hypothetical protein
MGVVLAFKGTSEFGISEDLSRVGMRLLAAGMLSALAGVCSDTKW